MKFGVVVFPGSNCDVDVYHVIKNVLKKPVEYIWHRDQEIDGFNCIILPGGFSYGDYLRSGAIARFSPVMKSVEKFASQGGLVLGICNGFQILLEAGLLPGALRGNDSQQFICDDTFIKVENESCPFTIDCAQDEVLKIPIAHKDGNYFAEASLLRELEAKGQVVFRYCDHEGRVSREANPNGSVGNVAGVCNESGNILGMMPHPERCAEELLGGEDGKKIFKSVLKWWEKRGGRRGS